jgi:IS30 family transposase
MPASFFTTVLAKKSHSLRETCVKRASAAAQAFTKSLLPLVIPSIIDDQRSKSHCVWPLGSRYGRFAAMYAVRVLQRFSSARQGSFSPYRCPTGLQLRQIMRFIHLLQLCSLTVDRGTEFATYGSVTKTLRVKLYYADPYSSWQRGSIEYHNGLLREICPKETDFTTVPEQALASAVALINLRPRKCHQWRSSSALLHTALSHLK